MNKEKLQNILCIVLPIIFVGVLGVGILKGKENKEELAKVKANYENSINTSSKPDADTDTDEEISDEEKEKPEENKEKFTFEDKTILFLGDGVSKAGTFQDIVKKELKAKEYINGGKNGLLLGAMDDDITAESLGNVDVVIVFGGTNDYSTGKPLGKLQDKGDIDSFYGNVQGVIDNIKALKEEIEIVFLTPLKHGYIDGQPSYPEANIEDVYLDDYAKAIGKVCDKNKVKYIDLFNESGIDESNVGEYTYNNMILNGAGNELVGKAIVENLKIIYEY